MLAEYEKKISKDLPNLVCAITGEFLLLMIQFIGS